MFDSNSRRAWKLEEEKKSYDPDDVFKAGSPWGTDTEGQPTNALDLTSFIKSASGDTSMDLSYHNINNKYEINKYSETGNSTEDKQRAFADREVVRRCLEYAYESTKESQEDGGDSKVANDNGDYEDEDLYTAAELAMRNPFAQRFLVSVLNQRCKSFFF